MVVGSSMARAIRRHRSASALSSVDVNIWVSPYLPRTPHQHRNPTEGKASCLLKTNCLSLGFAFDFHRARDELFGKLSQLFLRFNVQHVVSVLTTCGGLTSEINGVF